jgi:hypothetical protein
LTSAGTSQVDGFGKFNTDYNQQSSNNPALEETVALTGSGFTAPAFQAQSLFVANKNGAIAAAHIIVLGSQNGFTGYAAGSGGGSPPINTPAPASALLIGVGCLSLGMVRVAKKLRKRQPATV